MSAPFEHPFGVTLASVSQRRHHLHTAAHPHHLFVALLLSSLSHHTRPNASLSGHTQEVLIANAGYSGLGAVYDDAWYDDQFRASLESSRILVPFLSRFPQAKSVLDVGCGRGAWLKAWKECGAERVVGFDGYWNSYEKMLEPAIQFQMIACLLVVPPEHLSLRKDKERVLSAVGRPWPRAIARLRNDGLRTPGAARQKIKAGA